MRRDVKDIVERLEIHKGLFLWLFWFYPRPKGIPIFYQLYYLFPQKILRINRRVPWPVHFTSRILYYKNIRIGNRSAPGINAGCYVQARNGIIIGHNFRMGPNSGLISSNHALSDYDEHTKENPILIGNNVWLGMNVVVMPGVSIGNNVAVGANSVVTKNLPSDVIAAGNPCRVIRKKGPYRGIDYAALI